MGDPAIVVAPESFSSSSFADSFFFKQAIDLKYVTSQYHTFSPINSLTNATQVDFSLPMFATPSVYDLKNSYLEVGFKIIGEDGELPPVTDLVGPVNNVLHSMFKNVEAYFNDTRITTSSGHHAYKDYLKTYLSYNKDYKESVLRPSGWAEDSLGFRNSLLAVNPGYYKRLAMIANVVHLESRVNSYKEDGGTFIGRLGLDVEEAGPIVNGINIRLSYYLNEPEFFLMGGTKNAAAAAGSSIQNLTNKYKYKIHKFQIHALVHDLSPSLYDTLEARLRKQSAIMSYKRYSIVPFTIASGLTEWLSDSILPR